jgi:lipoyl(octanoyl) transferase
LKDQHQLRPWVVKELGRSDYQTIWDQMRAFTDARDRETTDELWWVEHDPVFTQGLAGKPEHVINLSGMDEAAIPLVQTDRGGQVTYHGPGQVVMYPLLDLDRLGVGVRCLVDHLEQTVIDVLASMKIESARRAGAPGVYVAGAKIASIGLKVRKGCTYHGLAVNVSMDLSPFSWINPCGMAGLPMTQVSNHCPEVSTTWMRQQLTDTLAQRLGYYQTN